MQDLMPICRISVRSSSSHTCHRTKLIQSTIGGHSRHDPFPYRREMDGGLLGLLGLIGAASRSRVLAIQAPCPVKPEPVEKPRRLNTHSLVPTFSALLKVAHQEACDQMKMRNDPLSTSGSSLPGSPPLSYRQSSSHAAILALAFVPSPKLLGAVVLSLVESSKRKEKRDHQRVDPTSCTAHPDTANWLPFLSPSCTSSDVLDLRRRG